MRKVIFLSVLLMLALFVSCAAADTEYSLSPCPASISIPDAKYIVLTRNNLGEHPELLSKIGMTQEEMLADWEERGVVLQAWFRTNGAKLDSCMEAVVRQDDDSGLYYDLVNHSSDNGWKTFVSSHKASAKYIDEGYLIQDVNKRQQKNSNYFLRFKYKRTTDSHNCKGYAVTTAENSSSVVYWGQAAKTVARGYTVLLDYQVFNRGLRAGDEQALRNMVNTMLFGEASPDSESASVSGAYLQITSEPPAETSTDTFTVSGRTTPGARVIGVLMNINSSDPVKFYADASTSNGSFKMKVVIPKEELWLLTLNVEVNGQIVAEKAFGTTHYSKTLLPLSFDNPVPERLTQDTTTISGYTDKGVDVQCLVTTNGKNLFTKQIRTNGTGRFSFKVPTSDEAEYNFTLVFSKKGYNTKRKTYSVIRSLTEEDRRAAVVRDAIRPGYSNLVRGLDKYVDKIMGYTVYIVSVKENGDEWEIHAAMNKTNAGYKNELVYMTYEEPVVEPGTQHLLYGKCVGFYQDQTEEGDVSYPLFDLLFIND